ILNFDPVNNTGGDISFTSTILTTNEALGATGISSVQGLDGANGGGAFGGGLYSHSGTLSFTSSTFVLNEALAGDGGAGGDGGSSGTAGGAGGAGGAAAGGGIYVVLGDVTIDGSSSVLTNSARGGAGGAGGNGGSGATQGGAGGAGGSGGSALGGGVWV